MSAKKQSKEMFEKIEKSAEIQKIWAELIKNQIEIYAKIGDSEKIILRPEMQPGSRVFCGYKPLKNLSDLGDQELLGQFILGGDKYFFKAAWTQENQTLMFSSVVSIYKLQRRQSFRLRVPESYHSDFVLTKVNDSLHNRRVKLWDLSSGGCCLQVPSEIAHKSSDSISGIMTLAGRAPVKVQGIVRHVRKENHDKKIMQVCGIEFAPISASLDSQLFTAMMELSRMYLRSN